jgi:hypothetical protein
VAADIKQSSLRELPVPTMYVPYTQNEIEVRLSMPSMQVSRPHKGRSCLGAEFLA